jgi:hypothetical protein
VTDSLQLQLTLDEEIVVDPTPDVLRCGASAQPHGKLLLAHRHVPQRPPSVASDSTWLAMLDLAEAARRYNQAPDPVLRLRNGAGSIGPMGTGMLHLDGRGCENWTTNEMASWPRLLAGLRAQRLAEPHVARARDLAEAFHYLDYYGRVYCDRPPPAHDSREWSPIPLIEQLARAILELGGDPTLVNPNTEYMRSGVRRALAPATSPA